jgi:hypothetical protein
MKRLKILTYKVGVPLGNDLSNLYVKSASRLSLKQNKFSIDYMQSAKPFVDNRKLSDLTNSFFLNTKLVNFKHKLRNTFRFILSTTVFNKCVSFISNFNKTLNCVFNLKKSYILDFAYFLLLKPGRGGYTCLYNGVVGFVFFQNIVPFIGILKKKSFLFSRSIFNIFRFTVSDPHSTIYPFYIKQKLVKRYGSNNNIPTVNRFVLIFSIQKKLGGYININKKIVPTSVSSIYKIRRKKSKKLQFQGLTNNLKYRFKSINKRVI